MAKIRPLSSGLAQKAKDELFEVESRIPEDIEALREWIKKQPHLKTPLGLLNRLIILYSFDNVNYYALKINNLQMINFW